LISIQKTFLKKYLKFRYRHHLPPKPATRQGAEVRDQIFAEYRRSSKLRDINIGEILAGSIKEPETCFLWDVIVDRKPSVVLQVGTFVGISALIIAEALKFNNKGILYAVDPEIPHRDIRNPVDVCRHFAHKRSVDDRIRFIKGWFSNAPGIGALSINHPERGIPVVSQTLLRDLGQVDMVFIDGDHSTLCCICDFVAVKNHLSKNGIVLFHDVNTWMTVMSAVYIILSDGSVRKSFRAGGIWKGEGIFFMERISSVQPVYLELSVIDAISRKPIANAIVKHNKIDVARTGAEGNVLFEHVLSGAYEIDIKAKGYRMLKKFPVVIKHDRPEQEICIEMIKA
jgi:predicted O-methyltransferase YrrM